MPSSKPDPSFPLSQLIILAISRLGEPIAFTSVLAYIYVYTKDIRHTADNAAFYAGLLVSAFAVAEVLTAYHWGLLSDRIGRKPVVLFALAGTAASNLTFGFATQYWVALASRFLGGLLNGNVAVMQTMVAEMCKKPEHEPRAYAMIPFVWSVGSILGSAMGGLLARPSESWPSIFPEDGLFGRYPYLLPNVVSVVYLFFAVGLGIVFLEETNESAVSLFGRGRGRGRPPNEASAVVDDDDDDDEQTPLLDDSEPESASEGRRTSRARRQSIIVSEPVTVSTTVDLRRVSSATTADDRPLISIGSAVQEGEAPAPAEAASAHYTWEMILLIWQLILMSGHSMAYGSLLPTFLVDEPLSKGLDLRGGLGYTVRDVGGFMAVRAGIAMLVQAIIFPPFVARVGIWKSFAWLTVLCPSAYVIVPLLTAIPQEYLPWGIYADMLLQNLFLIIIYPCLLILLKNATPSMSMLGRVNGLAMAACSGARTVAPPLVGAFYGSGGSAVGWWSITALGVASVILLYFMAPPKDSTQAQPEAQDAEV